MEEMENNEQKGQTVYDQHVKPNEIYMVLEGSNLDFIEHPKAVMKGDKFIEIYKADNWIDIINSGEEPFIVGNYYQIFTGRGDLKNPDGELVWRQTCFNILSAKKEKSRLETLNDEMDGMNNSKEFLEQEIERKRVEITDLKNQINIKQSKIEELQRQHEQDRIKWNDERVDLKTKISQLELNVTNEQWKSETEKKYERKSTLNDGGVGMAEIVNAIMAVSDVVKIFKGGAPSNSPMPGTQQPNNYEVDDNDLAETQTI